MDAMTASTSAASTKESNPPAVAKGASLAEQTHEFIKGNIISLLYPPGSALYENQLAKQLGISRSPMREAFASLEKEGFIEIEPWRGARVVEITRKYVTDLYQVRASLEGTAARLAVPRLDRSEFLAMKENMARLEPIISSGDGAAFYEHEVLFHDLYVTGCGNDLLLHTLIGLRDHIARVRNYLSAKNIPGHEIKSFHEHQAAIDAFLTGNGDAAEAAVREHLEGVLGRMLASR